MLTPIPVGAFHMSRQKFIRSLDFEESARNSSAIDRALAQATAYVENSVLHRGFFPWRGTKSFDWPTRDNPISWRLRLNDNELITLTAAVAGGETLSVNDFIPYPLTGPPYNVLETSIGSSSIYQSGDTWQSAVDLTGLWGYQATTTPVGTLVSTINSSVTSLTLSAGGKAGVGDVLLIESEYVVVRELGDATTGQTLQTSMTASNANTSVAVTSGAGFSVDEVITLDAERMLIVAITGNTLIVKRAWDGTVLAGHTGSTIYAPRAYTVDRGACGSTAASHNSATAVALHVIPAAVEALTTAEAGWLLQGHAASWQTAPGTTNRSTATEVALTVLQDLRKSTRQAIGRIVRHRAV